MPRCRRFALFVLVLGCAGCRDERDGAAARAPATDLGTLERVVAADQKLDRVLKEADDDAMHGKDEEAASLLERSALPAADEALRLATASHVETKWGEERLRELTAVLRDRREEIPRYAAGLRGTDIDAKLAAVQTQVALEKRTIDAIAAVSAGPGRYLRDAAWSKPEAR